MSVSPTRTSGAGRLDAATFAVLLVLLAVPVLALNRLAAGMDWRVLAGLPLAASFFTWLAYRSDKQRAEAGAWRIPELTLHLLELAGGWPGAFLAQRQFRHKTAKIFYQFVFWFIVLVHEFFALDFLLGWRLAKGLGQILQT